MQEWEICLRLVLSCAMGGIIGYERQLRHKSAGLRTNMLVALGSCLIMLMSQALYDNVEGRTNADPARLAAQVVSGIGFLGAGVILHKKNDAISGLTTAAIIWAAAAIGVATGAGFIFDAIIATFMILIAIRLSPYVHRWVRRYEKKKKTRITATLASPAAVGQFIQLLHSHNHLIENINMKDQANGETKLTIRCTINDKDTVHELYLLLKNEPDVLSLELEN